LKYNSEYFESLKGLRTRILENTHFHKSINWQRPMYFITSPAS